MELMAYDGGLRQRKGCGPADCAYARVMPRRHIRVTGAPEAPETGGPKTPRRPKPKAPGDVATPMPGKVVRVAVTEGQVVKKDDLVLIVEAMKMENQVHAPIAGTVKTLYVREGDDIKPDETLLVIE